MKTNKIWSILAMLVVSVTVVFFTSCSSDDDGDGSKDINVQEVVGTWTCTASTDKVDGKSITGYMVGESSHYAVSQSLCHWQCESGW